MDVDVLMETLSGCCKSYQTYRANPTCAHQQFSLWLLIECYESYPCHFWRQQGIKIDIAAHFRFESG